MAKVFILVGHGGKDPGAVGYIKEADANLVMAQGCMDYLKEHGVEVAMSRYKDENDTTEEAIVECNAFNPDLAVDVHANSGGGDGFEVFYHHLGGNSKKLAQNIERYVIAIGQNSRGCKIRMNSKGNADYYASIRKTKASSVICEAAFVDNKKDVQIIDTEVEQRLMGRAYAKGIIDTLKEMGLYTEDYINYAAHVENIGWQDEKSNWQLAGTEGKGLRLEAIIINSNVPLQYRVHIENIGWQDWRGLGCMAGTEGKGLRIEALHIVSQKPIRAQAHIEKIGDTQVYEGTDFIIGTEGKALRLESLRLDVI